MEYKSNNVVCSCKYHVVWCPKYRRKVLVNGVDIRLKALIEKVCSECRIEIIGMEIMPDHVHLLMEVDPQFGIHKAVKQIKGRTSRILRQEFSWLTTRLPTLWTNLYFVSTVGGAPLSVIRQYIFACDGMAALVSVYPSVPLLGERLACLLYALAHDVPSKG
ncbi:IS200/IS605 family transposase [Intestinimonas butyriciproducens]|uniref:IS200/IS605 family transposase n=1 Tax=Intestinimonas butyriciproducens TaxID=1297617 RepID=UPI001FAF8251|nr:IS200/IS605 family transposase [Intestinimonas butyriciproducens]